MAEYIAGAWPLCDPAIPPIPGPVAQTNGFARCRYLDDGGSSSNISSSDRGGVVRAASRGGLVRFRAIVQVQHSLFCCGVSVASMHVDSGAATLSLSLSFALSFL